MLGHLSYAENNLNHHHAEIKPKLASEQREIYRLQIRLIPADYIMLSITIQSGKR